MRQTAKHPIFYMFSDEPKMQIYAQFAETNVLVKHNFYQELKQTQLQMNRLFDRS